MDFLHSPISGYDEADPRDSDLGELPDAPNASRWNVSMLGTAVFFISPFIAILAGVVLAVVTR